MTLTVLVILGVAIVLGAAARICDYLMDRYVQRFWRRVETIKPVRLVIVGRKVH